MDGKSIITGNQGQGLSSALSASCVPAFFALLSRGAMSDRAAWGLCPLRGSGRAWAADSWRSCPPGHWQRAQVPGAPAGAQVPWQIPAWICRTCAPFKRAVALSGRRDGGYPR
jgi:hypothetical protein